MNIDLTGVEIGLILVGLLYSLKPNIFQRGVWKRTGIIQRILGPEKYLVFMRGLGIFLIMIGLLFSLLNTFI